MVRKKKVVPKKKINLEELQQKASQLSRYEVRNTLFRLRDNRVERQELAVIVWEVIQPQLRQPEGLKNFTFDWDVDPINPSRVIRRDEWDKVKADKYPNEYKKQEQVEEEITLFTGQA